MRRRWEVLALYYGAPLVVERCWTEGGAENARLRWISLTSWTGPQYVVRRAR